MQLVTFENRPQQDRILLSAHIADIHFGTMEPKLQYDILKEQFIDKIKDMPLDYVAINGDIFDHKAMANSNLIMYAINFVDTLIQEVIRPLGCTLIIIGGTNGHDSNQLRLFYKYMADNTIDVRIVETIKFEYVNGAKILCIPELACVENELYNQVLFKSGTYDEVCMHGTIKGAGFAASHNCRLFTMDDFAFCTGPIFSGHIHNGGCFNQHFYYCGSPYSWRFDDDYRKGFLICMHNLNTNEYLVHKELITSFRYETVNLDNMLNANPQEVIQYIDMLREKEGIDYIRIEFNNDTGDSFRYMMDSYYKNNKNVKFKYNFTKANKAVAQQLEKMNELEKYQYIFDNSLSEYDKLALYINGELGYEYIKSDRLKELFEIDNF